MGVETRATEVVFSVSCGCRTAATRSLMEGDRHEATLVPVAREEAPALADAGRDCFRDRRRGAGGHPRREWGHPRLLQAAERTTEGDRRGRQLPAERDRPLVEPDRAAGTPGAAGAARTEGRYGASGASGAFGTEGRFRAARAART